MFIYFVTGAIFVFLSYISVALLDSVLEFVIIFKSVRVNVCLCKIIYMRPYACVPPSLQGVNMQRETER